VTKIIIKTKLLKKAGVKGSLKDYKAKTMMIKVGSRKVNKKFIKAYKKSLQRRMLVRRLEIYSYNIFTGGV